MYRRGNLLRWRREPGSDRAQTLVYGATISALLFLFAAFEIFIVERLVELFEVTDHIATAFLGAAFGLAFHPMKHRIERLLHKFAPQGGSLPDLSR